MNTRTHLSKYFEYCKTCKYKDLDEAEEPCNECLTFPVNIDSRKPIKYTDAK